MPAYRVRALVESWVRPCDRADAAEELALFTTLNTLDRRLRTTGLDTVALDCAARLGVRIEPAGAA